MIDGAKFTISYQSLAFLSIFSRWQLIQNLAPSTIVWGQYDIRIVVYLHAFFVNKKTFLIPHVSAAN